MLCEHLPGVHPNECLAPYQNTTYMWNFLPVKRELFFPTITKFLLWLLCFFNFFNFIYGILLLQGLYDTIGNTLRS